MGYIQGWKKGTGTWLRLVVEHIYKTFVRGVLGVPTQHLIKYAFLKDFLEFNMRNRWERLCVKEPIHLSRTR